MIGLYSTTSGCGAALCDARIPRENSAVVVTVWACSSVSAHSNSVHSYSRGLRLFCIVPGLSAYWDWRYDHHSNTLLSITDVFIHFIKVRGHLEHLDLAFQVNWLPPGFSDAIPMMTLEAAELPSCSGCLDISTGARLLVAVVVPLRPVVRFPPGLLSQVGTRLLASIAHLVMLVQPSGKLGVPLEVIICQRLCR